MHTSVLVVFSLNGSYLQMGLSANGAGLARPEVISQLRLFPD